MSLKILTSIKLLSDFILVKYNNKKPSKNYSDGLFRSTSRRRGRYMLARSCSCHPGSRCNWTTCCPATSLTTAATESLVSPTQIIPRLLFDTALEFFTQEKT